MKTRNCFFPTVFLLAGACGTTGSPPEATAIALSTDAVPVGEQTTLDATVQFSDLDADLFEAETVITGTDLPEVRSTVRISGSTGLARGAISMQLIVVAPKPGAYSLSVRLWDLEGNHSEWVTADFEAR